MKSATLTVSDWVQPLTRQRRTTMHLLESDSETGSKTCRCIRTPRSLQRQAWIPSRRRRDVNGLSGRAAGGRPGPHGSPSRRGRRRVGRGDADLRADVLYVTDDANRTSTRSRSGQARSEACRDETLRFERRADVAALLGAWRQLDRRREDISVGDVLQDVADAFETRRFLSSALTTYHGQSFASVYSNIASLARE